jgi:hypothetical protein
MTIYFIRLVTIVVALPLAFAAPTGSSGPHLKIRTPNNSKANIIPNSYIFVFNDSITTAAMTNRIDSITSMLARRANSDATPPVIGAEYNMQGS